MPLNPDARHRTVLLEPPSVLSLFLLLHALSLFHFSLCLASRPTAVLQEMPKGSLPNYGSARSKREDPAQGARGTAL